MAYAKPKDTKKVVPKVPTKTKAPKPPAPKAPKKPKVPAKQKEQGYVVQPGESLASIAANVYSDPRLYVELIQLYGPGVLQPGDVLNLPSEAELRSTSNRVLNAPGEASAGKTKDLAGKIAADQSQKTLAQKGKTDKALIAGDIKNKQVPQDFQKAGKESGRPDYFMTQQELAAARLDLGYEGYAAEDSLRRAEIRQAYSEGLNKTQQKSRAQAAEFAASIGQTNLPFDGYNLEDPLGISPLTRILENRGIQVPQGATPEELKRILFESATDPNLPPLSNKWVSALEAAGLIQPINPFTDPGAAGGGYSSSRRGTGGSGYGGSGQASVSAATLGLINWRI